jgi:hypothetical protein
MARRAVAEAAAMSPHELLAAHGITLRSTAPGRYYTVCPKCSHTRTKAHQKAECLGVTIEGDSVRWGCNHCGWTGPEKGTGKGNGGLDPHDDRNFVATYDYPRFQKVRYPKGHEPRFRIRHHDGGGWKWGAGGANTNVLYRGEEVKEAIAQGYRIACVEGEKDANNLWAIDIPATCNAHGASEPGKRPKWTKEHSEQLRGADIVVFNDNDPAGFAHANATCQLSWGVAARICRLDLAKHWPNMPEGKDVSDWIDAGHTREELDALIEQAPDWTPRSAPEPGPDIPSNGKDKPPSRFKLVRFDQITLQTALAYLVAGLIPRVGLTVIWGPMKCGKSFWAFDLFMHVALGWPYRGRKVRKGAVVYLALEGHAGFNRRVEAFRQKHGVTGAPFYLITDRTDLVKDHAELVAAIRAQSVNPAAVVIDTLNRSITGSESKDEDMSAYIKAADAVRDAFCCAVVIIHHCGLDENRPRGHTSLGGSLDAQLAVKRDAALNVVVEVEWMKDGDTEGDVIISKLERKEVGLDEDRNVLSSCVVVPAEDAAPAPAKDKRKKPSKADAIALRALHEAVDELGTVPPASSYIPANTKVATFDQWRTYAYKRGISSGEQRAKEIAFQRSSERLIGENRVGAWNDQAWPAR